MPHIDKTKLNDNDRTEKEGYRFDDDSFLTCRGSTEENIFVIVMEDLDFRAYTYYEVNDLDKVLKAFYGFIEVLQGELNGDAE